MPVFLENKLKAEAKKKGFTGRRAERYIFGAMNDLGAMRGSAETAKGAAMERKHEAKVRKESHDYDWRRPKRPVRSRYIG